jgi:hypothetical protein
MPSPLPYYFFTKNNESFLVNTIMHIVKGIGKVPAELLQLYKAAVLLKLPTQLGVKWA